MPRTLFLDTHVLFYVACDSERAEAVHHFLLAGDYTLVTNSAVLTEAYPNNRRWESIAEFLSSSPFCITENVEKVTDREVATYPGPTSLHMPFRSTGTRYTASELKEAILTNLGGKVAGFHATYREEGPLVFSAFRQTKQSFLPPDTGTQYSDAARDTFLTMAVFNALSPEHLPALNAIAARDGVVDVTRFKTIYVQFLALWLEYVVQGKQGQASDVMDFLMLGYLPYVDESVLDNERVDLVRRINRVHVLDPELHAITRKDFLELLGTV